MCYRFELNFVRCNFQPSQPVPVGLSHNLVDKWEIPKSSVVLKERIGKGQFGEVYKAVWNGTTLVAVKTLRASKFEDISDNVDSIFNFYWCPVDLPRDYIRALYGTME